MARRQLAWLNHRMIRAGLSVFLIVVAPGAARASGNAVHAWITMEATAHLRDPALRSILCDPSLEAVLRNGTMFPDGGYAVNDEYGETAHWEPFQDRYLRWIRQNHAPFDSAAAREHVAFFMGMASHGLADQLFDATFMDRDRTHDREGWDACTSSFCSFDALSDIGWVQITHAQTAPEVWIPHAAMEELYDDHGQPVARSTMTAGQEQVRLGLGLVSLFAEGNDDSFAHSYPWGAAHIDDAAVPGTPPSIAPVVARYWESRWRELNGESESEPVNALLAGRHGWAVPRGPDRLDSRITLVFTRAITLLPDVELLDAAGGAHPIEVDLYYGDASHVLNIFPTTALAELTEYRVTVPASVVTHDGATLADDFTGVVRTHPPLVDVAPDSCGAAGGPWMWGVATAVIMASRRRRSAPRR